MNTGATTGWSQNLHEDMVPPATTEDDFTNYLDLDLDFSSFENVPADHGQPDLNMEDYDMSMESHSTILRHGSNITFNPHHVPMQPRRQVQQSHGHPPAQVYQPASRYQRPQAIIPPTPSSNELQGGVASYYHPGSGQTMYEQYHNKDDQMSFTPLVSPAVTPADATFHMPDYALPGEYFSPLTSPAIEAQNAQYRSYQSSHGPDTGATTSPAELNIDSGISTPSTPAIAKSRRRTSVAGKPGTRSSVRQSPMSKPNSRRKQANGNRDTATLLEQTDSRTRGSARNKRLSVHEDLGRSGSSEQDSVSPEALAEALMPPPAVPHSTQRSPAIAGQSKSPLVTGIEPSNSAAPATPATLMRLRNDHVQQSPTLGTSVRAVAGEAGDIMEDIMLPAPANVSSQTQPDGRSVSTSAIQPKPKLAIDSSGANSVSNEVLSASSTPMAPTPQSRTTMSPDGSDPKRVKSAGRIAKKRQSVSSSQVSPAIRPKISPNIKPLMPSGGVSGLSADHSALYLARKSNYQNILEGTHLPGVTYPETLAENLSSKRTSHKIAEQGRRQRINTALKEIEGLLPPAPTLLAYAKQEESESPEAEGSEKGPASNQATSKANTVEMAIIYIKALQSELADAKTKLIAAEKKLGESNSNSSQASE